MKWSLLGLLFVISFLISQYKSVEIESELLVVLDDINFWSFVENNECLIQFYVPRCQFCREFSSKWMEFVEENKGVTNFGVINCESDQRLCKHLEVKEAPHLSFFKEGKQYKYDGDRSKEDMVRFLYEYDQSKKALDLPDYESFKLKKEKDIEKSKIRKAQRGIISKILKYIGDPVIGSALLGFILLSLVFGCCGGSKLDDQKNDVANPSHSNIDNNNEKDNNNNNNNNDKTNKDKQNNNEKDKEKIENKGGQENKNVKKVEKKIEKKIESKDDKVSDNLKKRKPNQKNGKDK